MSQLNWRRPLALAVFLFVLAGFTYWLEFKHKPDEEAHETRENKFLALDKAQVQSIRLSNGSHEFSLMCTDFSNKMCRAGDNSKWELTAPLKVKADDSNSNSLLSTINTLSASDTISLKEETAEKKADLLKEYGLDAPSLSRDRQLEINTAEGTTVLYLGVSHPIGEGIFAALEKVKAGQKPSGKLDDSEVYVLPSYIKGTFDRDLTYWRDKKVLPVMAHEVEAFTLHNSKGEIRGERKNGIWTLHSKNDEVQGDIEAMDTMLTGATYLTAKNFISNNKKDPQARKALAGAKLVVTFSIKKENQDKPIVLTLYQKPAGRAPGKGIVQNRIFATVSDLDPLFELEPYSKERLDKTLQDLRLAKLITSMDRFSAKRLEFAGTAFGAKPWLLLNKDSKWVVDGQPTETINAEKVQNFLDHLTSAKINLFVTKDLPAESGGVQFALGDDSSPEKRKYVFWRDVGKMGQKLYAKDLLSHRKEVFLMDNTLSAEIPWDKAKLK